MWGARRLERTLGGVEGRTSENGAGLFTCDAVRCGVPLRRVRLAPRLALAPDVPQPADLVEFRLLDLGFRGRLAAMFALIEQLDLLQLFDRLGQRILRRLE